MIQTVLVFVLIQKEGIGVPSFFFGYLYLVSFISFVYHDALASVACTHKLP